MALGPIPTQLSLIAENLLWSSEAEMLPESQLTFATGVSTIPVGLSNSEDKQEEEGGFKREERGRS